MTVAFSIDDLTRPDSIERVLRQFQSSIKNIQTDIEKATKKYNQVQAKVNN